MTNISVAIPSIGRRSLLDTLSSLNCQKLDQGQTMEVIIADDAPDGRVRELIGTFDSNMSLKVLPVHSENIAIARNACVDAARGEVILFVDDDEVVEEDWARTMYRQVFQTNADCLFAPITPVYGPDAPKWLKKLSPLFPEAVRTGVSNNKVVGRTGNSAIRRSFIETNAIRFDSRYSRNGEDLFFFTQCASAGARMVAVDQPIIAETISTERLDISYVLSVLFRRGYVYADIRYRTSARKIPTALALIFWSLLKVCGALVALPLALLAGRVSLAKLVFRISLEIGKLRRMAELRV